MNADIHPTAIVDSRAELGDNVSIGPFCVIEAGAVLGDGCQMFRGAVVKSGVTLGKNNTLGENVVLGGTPQHATAAGPFGKVVVGDGNTFRENCTVHRSMYEDQQTTLGDNCYLMVNAHVGHDSVLDGDLIIANNAMLGGHVRIFRKAFVSGGVAIHQFCRVGTFAMVGGQARVVQDVPPYTTIDGVSSKVVGLNLVGLKRGGFSATDISQIKAAYRVIYRSELRWVDMKARLLEEFTEGPASVYHAFFSEGGRGFVSERRSAPAATIKFPVQPQVVAVESDLRKAS